MVTYSDMVTLLLAFFVLLLSFSTIDAGKFDDAVLSMRGAFGILQRSPALDNATMRNPGADMTLQRPGVFVPDLAQITSVYDRVRAAIAELDDGAGVTADIVENRGLVIRFDDNVLFDSGQALLRPDGLAILNKLAPILADIPNPIRVEGHTDNVPINTFRYPSNWELSTARAGAVIRYFIEEHGLDPNQMSAMGFAEFRPVADNATAAGRQRNRRVEIVVTYMTEPYERQAEARETLP